MAVADLDDLIERMEDMVADARRRGSPDGYFAALYLGVTRVVRDDVRNGTFAGPEQLTALTVTFAQRYLHAWGQRVAGQRPTAPWDAAFEAATRWRPTVLQHLLVGMNAHINLDLGVASAQVAPGAAIHGLRGDFDRINAVLAGMVVGVQANLNRVSPLYRFVDDVAGGAETSVVNFSISRARASAWDLATELAQAQPEQASARIASRADAVAALADRVLRPGFATVGMSVLRLTEWRSPAAIIDILSGATVRTAAVL